MSACELCMSVSVCVFQECACKYLRVSLHAFVKTSELTRLGTGGKEGGSERRGWRGMTYPAP